MPNHCFTTTFACVLAALAFAATVQAQNNRTFVSTAGSDSNNCGPTTPCRTFAAALALTNPGGELVVLTSGGYGSATINRPVTITAIGVDASITSEGDALTINTIGNVTINGLGLYGEGIGGNGIYVEAVGFLRLYNVTAADFENNGVDFAYGNSLAIYDSQFNDSNGGLYIGGGNAYVESSGFDHNLSGVTQIAGSSVVIADSHANYNEFGFESYGGTLSLIRDEAVLNEWGIFAADAGTKVQLSECVLRQNTSYAYATTGGATISGTSPGANVIIGAAYGGTPLSAATTLQ